MTLSALHEYPLKGAAGCSPMEAVVTPRGFARDRRWMLVDGAGRFLSQRTHPRLALIRVAWDDGSLAAEAPGMQPLQVARPRGAERRSVQVWGDDVQAAEAAEVAHAWFGRFLDAPCRLVYMPEDSRRPVDPRYAADGDHVSFADGFPFLLIGEASLAELNGRLTVPVPMNRFRPNLVVAGGTAFAEDTWTRVQIGAVRFRVAKPCARCAVTTVDQETAVPGREPLRTLARFRRQGRKVLFGQNLIPETTGTLRVGDSVRVLARKEG